MDQDWLNRNAAWRRSLTPAVQVDSTASNNSSSNGGRTFTYHGMTPASSTALLARKDARDRMTALARTVIAPVTNAASMIADVPPIGPVVKPVSAVTGPGAPPVSQAQQEQNNRDRLAEWNQMHPNGQPQLPQAPSGNNPNGTTTAPTTTGPATTAPTTSGPTTTAPTTTAPTTTPPTTNAPATNAPATTPPTTTAPTTKLSDSAATDPLIAQMLGTTGPIEQPANEVGSLPWLLNEVNRPEPAPATPVGNPAEADTTVTAEATVGIPPATAPVPAAPTQAELDVSRIEQIVPEGVALPQRGGAPVEWVDGNGTKGSLRIDEFGQRYWRFLQSDGRLIEVTQGGGSDGGDRPWTHTKITEPDQQAPRVDNYDTAGVTAYVDLADGVETRHLRFQGGDSGVSVHYGGSDGQDRPWSQTIQFNERNQHVTTRTQDGITWQGPVIGNWQHTRYAGNDGSSAEQTTSLSPWEPGFGYTTTSAGITKHFTTRDGVVTGGYYTDTDGADLGTFQVVNGETTFFANQTFLDRRWWKERVTSLRVVIGPDGKATSYYQVGAQQDETVRETMPGELPEFLKPASGPNIFEAIAKSLGHSFTVLGDVVGEYMVGPFISLGNPVATSQGVMFVPYQPPPDKRHSIGEVAWAAVDILSWATLFLPIPVAPALARLAATGRTVWAGAETAGRAVVTGAQTLGRPILSGAELVGRAALSGAEVFGRPVLTGAQILGRSALTGGAALGRQVLGGLEFFGHVTLSGAQIAGRTVLPGAGLAGRIALTGAASVGRSILTGATAAVRYYIEGLKELAIAARAGAISAGNLVRGIAAGSKSADLAIGAQSIKDLATPVPSALASGGLPAIHAGSASPEILRAVFRHEYADVLNVNARNYAAGRPGFNINCSRCVVATDYTLAGSPASAVGVEVGKKYYITDISDALGGKWVHMSSYSAIVREVTKWGLGSRGVVSISRGPNRVGHVFNVVYDKNGVVFIDGQIGGFARLEAFKQLHLLRTA